MEKLKALVDIKSILAVILGGLLAVGLQVAKDKGIDIKCPSQGVEIQGGEK